MAANRNYYTNMMTEDTHPVDFEDFSTPCNEQQSHKVVVTPVASSARPNHERSKNFNKKEDEILVSTWLNVEGRRQSGATMQDKIEDSRALYKSEDPQKRSFQFENCWKQLRGQAKWMTKLDELVAAKSSNKKQKKTFNLNLATPSISTIEGREVAAPEENTLSRPMEHKNAKAAPYQSGKKGCTEALENLRAKKKEFDTDKELKKDEWFKQAFALEQEMGCE
ncbi:unnamed protein product [Miscanthus lutarioriparius]|uniref:No apical meristem-associated C-terminal domain-containing protein n=1 Tax=Miscanthus lutarioriparius TaxID=422564 RepID=A0A811QCN5_9POAL|nr:unnamed protein product [Miscanthus lutarioriparius]